MAAAMSGALKVEEPATKALAPALAAMGGGLPCVVLCWALWGWRGAWEGQAKEGGWRPGARAVDRTQSSRLGMAGDGGLGLGS